MADPVVWSFAVGGELEEKWEHLTEPLPASTGPQYHRELRGDPRITISFEGLESARGRRTLENLLHNNGSGQWRVPLANDSAPLTVGADAAAEEISLIPEFRRFAAGAYVMLQHGAGGKFELALVSAVNEESLSLSAPLASAWPAGTLVTPLYTGRLAMTPRLPRFTGDDAPYAVAFVLDDVIDQPASFGELTYRDLPVFEWQPAWQSDPVHAAERRATVVDEKTGPITVIDMPGFAFPEMTQDQVLDGRAEIASFRALLRALCGQQAAIWVPTWVPDFLLVAAVADGANTLDVEHSGYATEDPPRNRRDIRIELADGTVVYRRITSAEAVSAHVERLTLDATIGTGFGAGEVLGISFLVPCCQASDTNVFRFWREDVAFVEMGFEAVGNDV